ncbi:hypothetical protein THICB1_200042 [Thiomonas arsenitoxydans]|uniref:Uncharacterized protein n=1 Tax=Thiomonas arsenitoxydans (strain DSM 22701 / CIP 110005 / 3As) TaxID=426114 RepID=A0ABM9T548_THIA3|nr:hypothetical protein THICB1_200042 [Thiomonas arsenitoxydans]
MGGKKSAFWSRLTGSRRDARPQGCGRREGLQGGMTEPGARSAPGGPLAAWRDPVQDQPGEAGRRRPRTARKHPAGWAAPKSRFTRRRWNPPHRTHAGRPQASPPLPAARASSGLWGAQAPCPVRGNLSGS